MTAEENKGKDDNVIYIGNKPFINYVTGVVMAFTTHNLNEVTVKSRGKLISRAVDVTEVATKRFLDNTVEVKDIKIGSEDCKNKLGKDVRVSFVEITLKKK